MELEGTSLHSGPPRGPATQFATLSAALRAGGAGDTAHESVQTASTAREDFWTTRVDHKLSDKDSLFGTYLFDDAVTHSPDPLNTWLVGNLSRRQAVIIEENHIFSPGLANTMRVGFSRVSAIVNSTISPINPASKDNTLGIYSANPQLRRRLMWVESKVPAEVWGPIRPTAIIGTHFSFTMTLSGLMGCTLSNLVLP